MVAKYIGVIAGCALSFSAMAGTMGKVDTYRPWSVIGSLGYTWFDNAYDGDRFPFFDAQSSIGDGQTPLGRFAIARDFTQFSNIHLGLEVGVQNGNTMRLGIPQVDLFPLGGLPVQVTVKPMLDLLATGQWQADNLPVFGLVKLGVAYRRLQINDRVTFNDLSQAAFEVQAGIGTQVSDRAYLSLNYQGVFGGSTKYTIDLFNFTGHISNIPQQNGVLLSLEYKV